MFKKIKHLLTVNRELEKAEITLKSLEETIQKSEVTLADLNAQTTDKKILITNTRKIIENEIEDEKNTIINSAQEKANQIMEVVSKLEKTKKDLKKEIVSIQHNIEMESFGLYEPQYDCASSLSYKEALNQVRAKQKLMIKDKEATSFADNWTVDGSIAKGRKMTNDNIKQILRAFNNECEAAINKVRFSNLAQIEKRIVKSFEQLNKLNESAHVAIKPSYLDLKFQELNLAYEYERKKQDEKEELKVQRDKEREEKALQKEIQSKKKIIDKDISHYKNMIKELQLKLSNSPMEQDDIQDKIKDFEAKMQDKENEKEELDYRNAHASAGYVYIISNIGAFGKDVVKIGVTRRLEPLERINELSSASVPFRFDVHALVFSYEAYQLENELHQHFNEFRINKINNRKEFFRVSIDKIEEKLREYKDVTIDFTKEAEAEEYKQSINISKTTI